MRVLGLDPSLTHFGWAIYNTQTGVCEGRGRFHTTSKDLFVDRYIQLREDLRDLVRLEKPDFVGVEYPVFGALYSEGMYGLFLYTCEALRTEGCNTVFFSPGQVKAHAKLFLNRPSKWKMEKIDMTEAAREHSGFPNRVWNHNEADAYWVSYAASRFWQLFKGELDRSDLNKVEKKQYTEIHTYVRGKKAGKTELRGIEYREDERFFLWGEIEDNDSGETHEEKSFR